MGGEELVNDADGVPALARLLAAPGYALQSQEAQQAWAAYRELRAGLLR